MRKPKARGQPVDNGRIRSWLEHFDGYRVAVTSERITAWLAQFGDDDADLGARVLDAVMFFRSENMEKALCDTVRRLPGWHKSDSRRRGRWRFVAFSTSGGESGDTMIHKCRTALGITGTKYNPLFIHRSELLREQLGPTDSVVFIDDFAGTGEQACGWSETLRELLPGSPKMYLVLVAAARIAVERIDQQKLLKVFAAHVLDSCDDVFSVSCPHFKRDEKQRLMRYCERADHDYPRGYGNCGFVVVFAHKTPNNSIPVLHTNHRKWVGLFPRYGAG